MKSHIIRNQNAAVLGLIAALVLLIFVIGTFLFFSGRLVSGQLQLNNATDSGILNAAKFALINPAVSLTDGHLPKAYSSVYPDFSALVDPNNNNCVDLLTYNRLVGQAVIIALNAEYEGTTAAYQNAQKEIKAVQAIGQQISNKINSGVLNNAFLDLAQSNGLSMLGIGPALSLRGNLQTAFIGQRTSPSAFGMIGSPSNIWVDASILASNESYFELNFTSDPNTASPPANFMQKLDVNYPNVNNMKYLAGYTDLYLLRNTPYETSLQAIPIITTSHGLTHIVDDSRFQNSLSRPSNPYSGISSSPTDLSVPPNALRAIVQSSVKIDPHGSSPNSNLNLTAISCAVVASQSDGYVACVPNGFIKIVNGPDLTPVVAGAAGLASQAYDSSNTIFNNELATATSIIYVAPLENELSNGADVTNLGVLYTTTQSGYSAIGAYFRFLETNGTNIPAQYQEKITINGIPNVLDMRQDPVLLSKQILRQTPETALQVLQTNPNTTFGIGVYNSLTQKDATIAQLLSMYVGQNTPGRFAFPSGTGLTQVPYTLNQTAFSDMGTSGPAGFYLNYALPQLISAFEHGNPVVTMPTRVVAGGSNTAGAIAIAKAAVIKLVGELDGEKIRVNAAKLRINNIISGIKSYLHVAPNNEGAMEMVHYASPNTSTTNQGGDNGATAISVEFGKVGTPKQLMGQIDSVNNSPYNLSKGLGVSYAAMVEAITQRMRQVNPNITAQNIQDALNSQTLDLGQTAYLYANPRPSPLNRNLVLMSLTPPPGATNPTLTPDGGGNSKNVTQMIATFDTFGTVIDTQKNGSSTAIAGDGNVHEQPFEAASPHPLAQEVSTFTTASGFNNLLGELNFTQQVGVAQTSFSAAGLQAGVATLTLEN